MSYHINNKGEARLCKASKGQCPFGSLDEHFDTVVEARAAYEESMNRGITLEGVRKPKQKPIATLRSEVLSGYRWLPTSVLTVDSRKTVKRLLNKESLTNKQRDRLISTLESAIKEKKIGVIQYRYANAIISLAAKN